MNQKYSELSIQLPTDNAVELMELIARSEVLGDQVAREIKEEELSLSYHEALLAEKWEQAINEHSKEKVAVMQARAEAAVASINRDIANTTARIKYLKSVNKLIESRCSVGQSFLSNMTAMVKAGINL